MGTLSIPQLLEDINAQINSHETLDNKLQQADALIRIGENADFDQHSNIVIHNYFSALSETIEQAVLLVDHISQELCRISVVLKRLPDIA